MSELTKQAYYQTADLGALTVDVPPDSIVSRTLHSDGQTKLVLFGFAQGQELSEHTASRPATLYFVRGEGAVTLGKGEEQDKYEVGAGTLIHMPPRMAHSVVAHTDLHMLLIMGEKD